MADWASRNQEHFDATADTYENHLGGAFSKVMQEVKNRRNWITTEWPLNPLEGKPFKVLEYACGPGPITRALNPYVTSILGIDVSSEMVNKYNEHIISTGLPQDRIFAKQGNLLSDDPPAEFSSPEFFNFDLVTVGFALHHFEDAALAAKKLAERLAPGGVFLVLDFVEKTLDVNDKISTSGFSQANLKTIFEDAGVGKGFEYVEVEDGLTRLHSHGGSGGKHHHGGHHGGGGHQHGHGSGEMKYFIARGERA